MDEGEVALPSLDPDPQEEGHYDIPKPQRTKSQMELNIYAVPQGVPAGPSAPSINNWETTNQQSPHQKDTDLERTVERCWPKDIAYAAQLAPPVGATHHMKGFRVYRDPGSPGYTSGIERIPDFQKRAAAEGGWEGPWEMTTWGNLIMDVVRDPEVPMVKLPPVPKETGASTNSLLYIATSLDAWGNQAAHPWVKTKKFIITHEDWKHKEILQTVNPIAHRVATPTDGRERYVVELTVYIVGVSLVGIYSV